MDRVVVLLLLVCLSGILVLGVCRFCGGFLFCCSACDRNQKYGILLKAFRLEMALRICLVRRPGGRFQKREKRQQQRRGRERRILRPAAAPRLVGRFVFVRCLVCLRRGGGAQGLFRAVFINIVGDGTSPPGKISIRVYFTILPRRAQQKRQRLFPGHTGCGRISIVRPPRFS